MAKTANLLKKRCAVSQCAICSGGKDVETEVGYFQRM
jgi:hypothetical protein